MNPSIIAVTWAGRICALALVLSLVGILAMIMFPAIKDGEALKALLTIAGISGAGVTGLLAFANHAPVPPPAAPTREIKE